MNNNYYILASLLKPCVLLPNPVVESSLPDFQQTTENACKDEANPYVKAHKYNVAYSICKGRLSRDALESYNEAHDNVKTITNKVNELNAKIQKKETKLKQQGHTEESTNSLQQKVKSLENQLTKEKALLECKTAIFKNAQEIYVIVKSMPKRMNPDDTDTSKKITDKLRVAYQNKAALKIKVDKIIKVLQLDKQKTIV